MSKIENPKMKQYVYEYIRDMILSLKLRPGDRIPETQIAEELGISRTPVREAVRLLSWEGLIDIKLNRSATVVELDPKTIQDLLMVRWQHDSLAVPLAVYNGSNREFADLRRIAEQCIEANDAGDIRRRHELDSQFHQELVRIGGNGILLQLHARVSLTIRLWQALHIAEPDTMRDGLLQHLELVDCLEKRDTENALRVIRDHYIHSYGASLDENLPAPMEFLFK